MGREVIEIKSPGRTIDHGQTKQQQCTGEKSCQNVFGTIEQLENFSTELFSTPGTAKFAAMLTEAYKTAEKPDIRLLLAELDGDESEIAGAAAALAEDITSPLESAADCINSILYDKYSERIRQLAALSEAEADKAKRAELLREQMNLMLKLRKT